MTTQAPDTEQPNPKHAFDCPLPMRGGRCNCNPEVQAAQLDLTGIHDQVWHDDEGGPDA